MGSGTFDGLFSLEDRIAVVTGASRGLGVAIAQGLVAFGAKVYLIARDEAALEEASHTIECGRVHPLPADLSQPAEIERIARVLGDREQAIDILVNNAATVWNAPLDSFPTEGWDKVLNLNLRSPFFLIQHLLPLLRAAAGNSPPSRIINVASTDALHVPITDTYSYTAAKAGLVMLTRMLARRLGPEQIAVNAIAPGPFPTKMTNKVFEARGQEFLAQIPLGRFGTPADIAGAAVFLASRAGAFVSGCVLPVDGGLVGGL